MENTLVVVELVEFDPNHMEKTGPAPNRDVALIDDNDGRGPIVFFFGTSGEQNTALTYQPIVLPNGKSIGIRAGDIWFYPPETSYKDGTLPEHIEAAQSVIEKQAEKIAELEATIATLRRKFNIVQYCVSETVQKLQNAQQVGID
jgi:hypothetical protein